MPKTSYDRKKIGGSASISFLIFHSIYIIISFMLVFALGKILMIPPSQYDKDNYLFFKNPQFLNNLIIIQWVLTLLLLSYLFVFSFNFFYNGLVIVHLFLLVLFFSCLLRLKQKTTIEEKNWNILTIVRLVLPLFFTTLLVMFFVAIVGIPPSCYKVEISKKK